MKGLKLLVCIFLISILQRIAAYNQDVQQDEEYYDDDYKTSAEPGYTQDMMEGGECKGTGPVKAREHCQTCRCDYGKIKCNKVSCEAPYLQPGCKLVNVTGSCCPEMQCGSTTTPIPKVTTQEPECDGSGPIESEDPCESCVCKNGEIVCRIIDCPKLSLRSGCKLVKVPGKCCQEINCMPIITTTTPTPYTPRPECTGTGPVTSPKKCQTCRCVNQHISCAPVTCPKPYLQPGCKMVKYDDECCEEMECEDTTKKPIITTPRPECTGTGPVTSPKKCQTCRCINQRISCAPVTCPKPYLQPGCKMVKYDDECCEEMECEETTPRPVITTPRPECTGTGPVTSSKKCQTCRCVNQRISCAPVTCPKPYLQPGCKMVKYDDECCEEMECETTTPKPIITTEPPECYGTGPVKNEDKCQNCRCNMGKIICSPLTCPQPYVQPGCKLVKVPGECCEEMQCEEASTTEEPTEEPTPSPECYGSGVVKSPDACKSCKCNMGKVICNAIRCSQPKLGPGCQLVTNPGQCCPEAKCVTTTTTQRPPECSGNEPIPSKDKCKTCHCLYGKISCKPINCPRPYLEPGCELVDVPGQCCPEVECEELETTTELSTPPPECYGTAPVKSNDICKTCRCNLGKIICTPIECSLPNLRPGCKMVKVPGRCCSEMKCEITTTLAPVPPPECTGSGPVKPKNKCQTCRCLYGKISCVPVNCPRPYLEPGCELVNITGECCPEVECEDITTTPEPDCYGSGSVKSDDPCKSCRCSNGDIVCSAILCSPQKLGPGCKYVKTPGQCCPSMKCEPITTHAPPPECTGSGPITSKDKCKTCHCMYGKIICTAINCPRPYLEPGCQLLNVPGECCPEVECEERTTPKPECTGSGPVPSKDKCKTCRCLSGKISCTTVNCPKQHLKPDCQLVNVPGECCPEVECDEEPTPEPECYGSGPVKSEDPCETCRCNMGEVVCNAIQCDQPKLGPGCKMVKTPGQCCPSMKCEAITTRAPPPECTGSGPVPSKDKCKTCRCLYGKISCTPVNCPKPHLEPGCQLVNVPGECCPEVECEEEPTPEPECYGSGPVKSDDPCETCRCNMGEIICNAIQCDQPKLGPGCKMVKAPGQCCPSMKCEATTTRAPPPECTGSGPVTSKDKCKTCRCLYGKISCTSVNCPKQRLEPGCQLVNVPGECCPEVECEEEPTPEPECYGSGPVKSEDPCETCRCNMGEIVCNAIQCDQPRLGPGCKMVNMPGQCCPTMKCEATTTRAPPPECTGSGPVTSRDKCKTCRCMYGKISCTPVTCPRPYLEPGCKLVNVSGGCCSEVQCEEKPTPEPDCYGSGPVESEDPCKTCRCSMGEIVCNTIRCTQPKLQPGCKIVKTPGQCCPSMKCEPRTTPAPPPPECTGSRPVPSKDKCKKCICIYGKISCTPVTCPKPYLEPGCELVNVPGECCPEVECEAPTTPEPECYGSGPVKSQNPCETCRCNMGEIVCSPIQCSQPKLEPGCKMVKAPGQCCASMKCVPRTTAAPPPECTGSGPVPSRDKCKKCICIFGKISCTPVTCPKPYLEPGCELVKVPGECCPDVECEEPPTPEPECYGSGPVKSQEPCETCHCNMGEIVCSPIQCSQPKLGPGCKLVKAAGQCCPSVKCDEITTTVKPVPPPDCTGLQPVSSNDPCKTCRCNFGKIICSPIPCQTPYGLQPGCKLIKIQGQCCPQVQCDQRVTDNPVITTRPPRPIFSTTPAACYGSGSVPARRPCETCQCANGKIICKSVSCPRLPLLKPNCRTESMPGQCCPEVVCDEPPTDEPECDGSGPIDSENPCESCKCFDGQVKCVMVRCQTPVARAGCRIAKIPGKCCPELVCDVPVTTYRPPTSTPACYGSGPVETDIPCAICECRNGNIACKDIPCPNFHLNPGCKTVKIPGKCCPEMKCDVAPPPSECRGSGPVPTSDICEECVCNYGRKQCHKKACPPLQRPNGNCKQVQKEDCCCPEWECVEPKCIPGKPIPSPDPCEICHCIQGNIRCVKQQCKPAPGQNCRAIPQQNKCCPAYECDQDKTPPPIPNVYG